MNSVLIGTEVAPSHFRLPQDLRLRLTVKLRSDKNKVFRQNVHVGNYPVRKCLEMFAPCCFTEGVQAKIQNPTRYIFQLSSQRRSNARDGFRHITIKYSMLFRPLSFHHECHALTNACLATFHVTEKHSFGAQRILNFCFGCSDNIVEQKHVIQIPNRSRPTIVDMH